MENKEFYLEHDGIKLHCKLDFPPETEYAKSAAACVSGDAVPEPEGRLPLVILVHGFTGHMEEPHLVGLTQAMTARGYAVLRVELYGHGGSGGSFHDHSIWKWVSEVNDVIRWAGKLDFVKELYVIGHSAGGLTAMISGAMMEDRLKALVLLAPALNCCEDISRGILLWCTFDPEHLPDELDFGNGNILGDEFLRTVRLLPVEQAMASFTKPVLVVHADTDARVPLECGIRIAEKYQNGTLAVIYGGDHDFNIQLDEMIEAVLEFLDRQEGRK